MFKNPVFNLSGVGYLHEIVRKDQTIVARINIINKFNSSNERSDDIWLDAHVKDNDLLQLLVDFEKNLQLKKTVILHFEAGYSGLDCCHLGLTEDDPWHIVKMQGQLFRLNEYYIDGVHHHAHPLIQSIAVGA
ncbi:MAG: hypothetical protein ABI370_03940 [Gammaproteobacteria bacterium]